MLVIYGPRRTGKTTLLKNFLPKSGYKYRLDSGDDIRIQQALGSQDGAKILEYAEGYELIAIDEAQYIPEVGRGLKLLVDAREDIIIIATGSSSLDLSGKIGEPLTGRKRTLTLFPVSQAELLHDHNKYELKERLEEFLIYGSYPETLTLDNKDEKREYLNEVVNSYLLKDILALGNIKAPKKLYDLLKLLAFQTGNEVSHNELATNLGMSGKTVTAYLDLLEKMFVVINLRGFSRNLRSEIVKKSKYYFYDTGIRNAIISNFNPPDLRNDTGALWENFMVLERLKAQHYQKIHSNNYFWRT